MQHLTESYIKRNFADSALIYQRGVNIFAHGTFLCIDADWGAGTFRYSVDGNYGDYVTSAEIRDSGVKTRCTCPYPGAGCKHSVAVLLDIADRLRAQKRVQLPLKGTARDKVGEYLTMEEIKSQALADRRDRAKKEEFTLLPGDMFKGEHIVRNKKGVEYVVTLHDPNAVQGHCSCPDFLTNRLGTCKHLIYACESFKKENGFHERVQRERFPFVDIYWDSVRQTPAIFKDDERLDENLASIFEKYFTEDRAFACEKTSELMGLISSLKGDKRIRIGSEILKRLDESLMDEELAGIRSGRNIDLSGIKAELYPYQREGVEFALYRKAALIGDEMGLGKTLQAIVTAILKKEILGFDKVLIITMASLKEQWRREIEKFTEESATVVAGGPLIRRETYENDKSFFKITNYEAVLRDTQVLTEYEPDLVVLDEAQRIKNFNTKTAEAVKSVPRKHSMVLTGTPLENKLEDVYSIVQFLAPGLLSPLWMFAGNHFMLSGKSKGRVLGYKNLNMLHDRLKPLVIRRKKEEVLSDLPESVVNNWYIELTEKQSKIHAGYISSLIPLINKKFLTPMDVRRILELLLKARQVCDSTFLIDRKTNISPKLEELAGILDELVIQSNRKVVIFTEWTTMLYLIAKRLSRASIPFVELSGKIPVHKRQPLIDEFTNNPDCKVFLSTDAGGTGLNLQAADCVVNFELPWNPAKLNQRIGRVNRIGQESKCVNVVNLIAKFSIEEKIFAGLQMKTELFKGVFEGGDDEIEFSREKRNEMLNRLREMMGEEPDAPKPEPSEGMDIPEDTPYYLNPEVLDSERKLEYDKEEASDDRVDSTEAAASAPMESTESTGSIGAADEATVTPAMSEDTGDASEEIPEPDERKSGEERETSIFESQSPEKIENVLNSGMSFIGGLLEMATGKKMESASDDGKMISLDRETGEVTMKFKLPGF